MVSRMVGGLCRGYFSKSRIRGGEGGDQMDEERLGRTGWALGRGGAQLPGVN